MPPHLYTPIHSYAPRGVHTPICPHSSVHLYVFGGFVLCGVVMGSPLCWDTSFTSPLFGSAFPSNYTPHTELLVPCALLCFKDISMLCGHFPSVEGFGGAPHQLGGIWGHQHLRCPYAHSCTFFVVHYVSHFNYGYDYYSSSYSGIFWPVISDSGSFPDRVFQ